MDNLQPRHSTTFEGRIPGRQGPQLTAPSGFENFPNVIIDDLSSLNLGPEQNAPQSYTQNVYNWLTQSPTFADPHTFKMELEGEKIHRSTNASRERG